MIKLRWIGETVHRVPGTDGEKEELLESVNYNVENGQGESIGDATVNNGEARLTLRIYNYNSVEEGVAKLMETLGIAEEDVE